MDCAGLSGRVPPGTGCRIRVVKLPETKKALSSCHAAGWSNVASLGITNDCPKPWGLHFLAFVILMLARFIGLLQMHSAL